MGDDDKVRENRLRRMAMRQGLQLVKSRRRDPRALDYGTYGILEPFTHTWVAMDFASGRGYGLDLDDIEERLTTGEPSGPLSLPIKPGGDGPIPVPPDSPLRRPQLTPNRSERRR